jgi:hypothetical protein
MSEACDICQRPVQWPSHYGDWECPHCHQPYEYDEGLRISLTDAQWALLRNPPRWIPVEERLPEEGVRVLVCNIYGGSLPNQGDTGYVVDHGVMEDGEWCIQDDLFFHVTHWMPLPSPPDVK